MAKVILEKFVMHVMIRRRSQSYSSERRLPRKSNLRVYQRKPIGVGRSKCHVRPHVTIPNDVRGYKEGEEYHNRRVRDAPVEGIE